ncbi:FUSC family protein [Pseudonocardia sp. HH130630-07]|uniref:FUSC family protein n=1 Tax=Pseudonocardia sp. HH130630-07 TaxID=1690815 RepID=UPI000AB7E6CF|nr:FUSC family protein [Pseudonocardia sp. HH130630-07]
MTRNGWRRAGNRLRVRGRLGVRRVRASWLPILQCAVAAGLALWVAGDLVGHTRPFFAPIAAVISLGLSLNSRLRRASELVVGVSLGVLVGDLLIAQIGSGVWQLVLVVALAITLATFFDGGNLIVAQAGASAVLVTTLLPPGETGGIDRCVDALIGGMAGILVAAVLPVHPVRIVRREARRVLDDLVTVLTEIASALRSGDRESASRALRRARDTQGVIDGLRTAVGSAGEVAAVSPLHRPRRRMLRRYRELAERTDYAHRNARVLARRALTAIEDGERVPAELPDTIVDLAGAVDALIRELGQDGDRERARGPLLDAVRDVPVLSEVPVVPAVPRPEDDGAAAPAVSVPVLVAQVRSIAIDLLQATGMTRTEAMHALRGVPPETGVG